MNRREVLRSLAGGCAAGALAAAGVALAVPVTVADDAATDASLIAKAVERFQKLPEPEQRALLAVMEADVEGTDPTEAVYAALGEERGELYILWWRNGMLHGSRSWFTAEAK